MVGALKGSLPAQCMEEARTIREEVMDNDTDRKIQTSLVNKSVGVLLKISMDVKPCTHATTKEESDDELSWDDLVDEDRRQCRICLVVDFLFF